MTSTDQASWARSEGDSWDIVSSVGYTALGVSAQRAVESERSDALIDDPFAKHFVLAAGEPHLIETITKRDAPQASPFSICAAWVCAPAFSTSSSSKRRLQGSGRR